jgi:hypothetical protein
MTPAFAVGLAALFALAAPPPPSDLPTLDAVPPEILKRDFSLMKFRPFDDPELACGFGVPNNWESRRLTAPKDALLKDHMEPVTLLQVDAPDRKSKIELAYTRVPENVDLEQWARVYLQGNQLKVKQAAAVEYGGRQVFDTLVEGPGPYLARMSFFKRLDRMFIFFGSAPPKDYPGWAKVFGVATSSFVFLEQPAGRAPAPKSK